MILKLQTRRIRKLERRNERNGRLLPLAVEVAHQTAALGLRVLVVAAAPDQVLLPVVHRAVQLARQVVPEIEEENGVVAKVLILHGDMIIKKRRERKREKEIGIGIEIAKRRRKREAILFLINLNLKDAPDLLLHVESVENVHRSLDQQKYILAI